MMRFKKVSHVRMLWWFANILLYTWDSLYVLILCFVSGTRPTHDSHCIWKAVPFLIQTNGIEELVSYMSMDGCRGGAAGIKWVRLLEDAGLFWNIMLLLFLLERDISFHFNKNINIVHAHVHLSMQSNTMANYSKILCFVP